MSDEFGVYCIRCGNVRWGKHSDEVRKCPNCGNTKKLLMMNVNKGDIENKKDIK
jgi:predicted  nucleic acid-binding Zn-ribbon protein